MYSKPIKDITWEDVELFCKEQVPESAYLDYKQDFPRELGKIICSMANTFGGIILIGVEEDSESKPRLPIKGIKFSKGLEEKITGIVLSTISPPIIPETQVCLDREGEKAVIVIRIPQSHQTPHATNKNTNVYIRTGNMSTPEELASLDRIEWLRNSRRKSEELREFLFEQAHKRCLKFYRDEILREQKITRLSAIHLPPGVLSISTCPVYPLKPLLTPPEIGKYYPRIKTPDYYETYETSEFFPISKNGYPMSAVTQDGNVLFNMQAGSFYYTELNIFGLYFYCQSLLHEIRNKGMIRVQEIFCRLDEFLDTSIKFYREIGYQGLLLFKVELSNLFNDEPGRERTCYLDKGTGIPPRVEATSPDKDVKYSDIVLTSALSDLKNELIYNSSKKIAWAFGWDLDEKTIDDYYYKKSKR